MPYKVYNERNIMVTVTEEQLEKSLDQNGKDLPLEMFNAMCATHDKRFSPLFIEALHHEKLRCRIKAIYGLLSLSDPEVANILQEREKNIPEEDFKSPISEKAIIQAVLIRLTSGPEGARNAFFTSDIQPLVKTLLPRNYSSSKLPIIMEDLEFIIDVLESYVNRNESWMKKMKQSEYEGDVISCLEGILRVSEETDLLKQLKDDFIEKICKTGSQILKNKIDSYAKETIATFARGLPKAIAYEMLQPIMGGNCKGDLRKELEKTTNFLDANEPGEGVK